MVEQDGGHVQEPVALPDGSASRFHRHTLASLTAALRAGGAGTRRAAAEALGRRGDVRAVPALVKAVEDEDAAVREAAAEALACMGSLAVPALIEALTGEPICSYYPIYFQWPRNREVLATLLGRVGDVRAIAPLVRCLDARDGYVMLAAAEALDVLAARYPVPEIRAALPSLRRRERLGWMDYLFRRVIRRIEAATASVKDMPVPAAPGGRASKCLPVPAGSPAEDDDSVHTRGGGQRLRRLLLGWVGRRTEGA